MLLVIKVIFVRFRVKIEMGEVNKLMITRNIPNVSYSLYIFIRYRWLIAYWILNFSPGRGAQLTLWPANIY